MFSNYLWWVCDEAVQVFLKKQFDQYEVMRFCKWRCHNIRQSCFDTLLEMDSKWWEPRLLQSCALARIQVYLKQESASLHSLFHASERMQMVSTFCHCTPRWSTNADNQQSQILSISRTSVISICRTPELFGEVYQIEPPHWNTVWIEHAHSSICRNLVCFENDVVIPRLTEKAIYWPSSCILLELKNGFRVTKLYHRVTKLPEWWREYSVHHRQK